MLVTPIKNLIYVGLFNKGSPYIKQPQMVFICAKPILHESRIVFLSPKGHFRKLFVLF